MPFLIKKRIEYAHKCLFEFPFYKKGNRKYPFIEVDLLYIDPVKEEEGVACLLDSGADYSVLPKDLGERLGIDFTEVRVVESPEAIAGKINCKCYLSPLTIKFLGATIKTEVIWIDKENITPVIGRKGFFEKFDVYFKESSDKITLVFHSTPECHIRFSESKKDAIPI